MVYFASDLHLSVSKDNAEKNREKLFIRWLDEIQYSADKIFLLGDMMNLWFEYKDVIPRGYSGFLRKLTELTEKGVEIHYFVGNHDMWTVDYLSKEIGLIVHRKIEEIEIESHRFLLGHGHELIKEIPIKMLFKLYGSRFFRHIFAFAHPRIGIRLGNYFSDKNERKAVNSVEKTDRNRHQIDFALQQLESRSYDYFVFGHTHFPCLQQLSAKSVYVNLGDWIKYFSYAVFDGKNIQLKYYTNSLNITK